MCSRVFGTTWHGVLETDDFRRAFLTEIAGIACREFVVTPDTDFAGWRETQLQGSAIWSPNPSSKTRCDA